MGAIHSWDESFQMKFSTFFSQWAISLIIRRFCDKTPRMSGSAVLGSGPRFKGSSCCGSRWHWVLGWEQH